MEAGPPAWRLGVRLLLPMKKLTLNEVSQRASDLHVQTCKFVCDSVRVRNLVSDIKGGTRLRVFEGAEGIFGSKRDDMTGGLRKLLNEELHNLNSSPSVIRMIKSSILRWTGHLVR
jgi:hypothetical protein